MLASVPCLVNVELRWAASPAGWGGGQAPLHPPEPGFQSVPVLLPSLGPVCPLGGCELSCWGMGRTGVHSVWLLLGTSFKHLCWSP